MRVHAKVHTTDSLSLHTSSRNLYVDNMFVVVNVNVSLILLSSIASEFLPSVSNECNSMLAQSHGTHRIEPQTATINEKKCILLKLKFRK